MSISKKSKVVEIKAAISSLGFKVPNLKKDDLLLFYEGVLRMKEENIQETKVNKDLVLDYTPLYMREDVDYQTHLLEYGWCVVQVEDFPLQEIKDGFFSWLERACPRFSRGNKSTWLKKNMPYTSRGIFKQYIGHTEFCWRMRESVYSTFASLWGEEDLLTSFDGGCFLTGEKNIDYKNWLHCDQSRKEEGFVCMQGIVNLYDSGEEDGGTLLMEGSHKCFSTYLLQHPTDGLSAFFPVDPFCPTLSSCLVVKPCLKAGELLLFDSRVFHCNVAPKSDQPRMCLYVSMTPRAGANKKELEKRVQTYEKGRMTGHWCYGDGFTVCPEHAHYIYSKDHPVPEVEIAPCNTELRRRLVGY
nr:2OG-Fe(II) oxygenase [Cedratvirus borely]